MRDPLVVRVAKLTCVALIVWVLLAWISGQAKMSIWQNSAPSLIPNNDQFHSTQLIIPNIQQNPSSPYSSTTTMSKIAKVTMVYYQNTTNDTILYEDALRSHKAHNDQHGYLHHVLRRSLLSIQYSKPAYVLSVILQELVKPPGERLEWLVYVSAVYGLV